MLSSKKRAPSSKPADAAVKVGVPARNRPSVGSYGQQIIDDAADTDWSPVIPPDP